MTRVQVIKDFGCMTGGEQLHISGEKGRSPAGSGRQDPHVGMFEWLVFESNKVCKGA